MSDSSPSTSPPVVSSDERPSSRVGGRTDGNIGMELGLAPGGLSTSSHIADPCAPESLGARSEVAASSGPRKKRVRPEPKENSFNKMLREAAKKRKEAKMRAAAAADPPAGSSTPSPPLKTQNAIASESTLVETQDDSSADDGANVQDAEFSET